jgi:hypothetical protein
MKKALSKGHFQEVANMNETQEPAGLRYYRRWEIAAAKEQTAYPCAFVAAFFAGLAAQTQWHWWVWTVCSFAWVFAMCTYGYSSDTTKAWREYERQAGSSDEPGADTQDPVAAIHQ